MSVQVLPSAPAPSLSSADSSEAEGVKGFNALSLAGVAFGLISILYSALGVMPILGIVFSSVGLVSYDARREKMRWMAGFGLGLSMLVILLRWNHR